MIPVTVNRRWTILMPEERAARPGWDWWEQDRLAYMHAVIRPGDCVWEIGAEQGEQAALYASWGAHLVLVEPAPGVWPMIKATFEANQLPAPIVSWCGFAADRNNDAPAPKVGEWPWEADETWEDEDFAHLSEARPRDSLATLDALSVFAPKPNVVSIDVEGAEYRVLMGAEHLITEVRPIWFISIHPEMLRERYGDTPDDVLCHLEKHGYDLHRIAYDHEVHLLAKPKP